ncbi:hypothetical protein J6590_011415 [Homalodisca vitripennis]|nr:hypothetical protein J6590_011415 [Homalodisca vitripennis]
MSQSISYSLTQLSPRLKVLMLALNLTCCSESIEYTRQSVKLTSENLKKSYFQQVDFAKTEKVGKVELLLLSDSRKHDSVIFRPESRSLDTENDIAVCLQHVITNITAVSGADHGSDVCQWEIPTEPSPRTASPHFDLFPPRIDV